MSEYENFGNQSTPEQKIDATSLSVQIHSFISGNKKIKPTDWIILNKLLKQLDKQRYNESRKVLRSMQNKFESIQNKYQRD